MISEILYLPDAHAHRGVSNKRFQALGNYLVEHQPPVIICAGDFADMTSLSKFDVGKKSAEGYSYEYDLDAVRDANEKLWGPVNAYNRKRLDQKKSIYRPRKIMTLGNHEYRIVRAANEDPKFYGHVTLDDLEYKHWGWEVIPFLKPITVEGVKFQHYFTDGNFDTAISGVTHAKRLIDVTGGSAVQGHSHELKMHRMGRGKERWGIVGGCYFDHKVSYVSPDAQKAWWRGIIRLHDVRNGSFNPQLVKLDYIQEYYL